MPEGEPAKTLDVRRAAAGTRCSRRAATAPRPSLALGGGAVGDLAGFVAATYMRGINFVQLPTTLLAQVDASIGGKTAIDHPRAKNLIGAFHQPRLVIVDPAALATLPEREFRSGLAEIVKHGIVLDADVLRRSRARRCPRCSARDLAVLERIIAGSCRLKAAVVERDEQEAELRHVLNYGHTIGHALEAATGFARFTHGEAVVARDRRRGPARRAPRRRRRRRRRAAGAPAGAARAAGPRRGRRSTPRPCSTRWGATRRRATAACRSCSRPRSATFRLVFDVPPADERARRRSRRRSRSCRTRAALTLTTETSGPYNRACGCPCRRSRARRRHPPPRGAAGARSRVAGLRPARRPLSQGGADARTPSRSAARASRRYPHYTTARLILAKALLAEGQLDAALAELDAILETSPKDVHAIGWPPRSTGGSGRIDAAVRAPGDGGRRSIPATASRRRCWRCCAPTGRRRARAAAWRGC